MASTTDERPKGGSLTAAISSAIVRITAEYIGRGPTKARTSIRDDMIVVLMQDTLTKAEKTLLDAGHGEFVVETRARFQMTMREAYVAAVEMLTERKVIAFMSANHMDPDMAAEIFIMEPGTPSECSPARPECSPSGHLVNSG
jgi:uncharacterized protein YbcI